MSEKKNSIPMVWIALGILIVYIFYRVTELFK